MRTPQESQELTRAIQRAHEITDKDINSCIDQLEKEIASLKELLERALPKVMDRKYARALDKKDYSEEVQWQKDYDVLLKTTQARREK